MVATPSMRDELDAHGFKNLAPWSRGVDTDLFHPSKRREDRGPFKGMTQPIWLNVGRVAVEKNIAAFVETPLPGTKVVVGDGPQLESLREKHPEVHFLGVKQGEELAACFANADVFVFPSLTDTFGLVILEAMAAGTPVAGYKAPGPRDIIPGSKSGAVDDDLAKACMEALKCSREDTRKYAEGYSWRACAEQFIDNLEPLPVPERRRFWKKLARLRHAQAQPQRQGAQQPQAEAQAWRMRGPQRGRAGQRAEQVAEGVAQLAILVRNASQDLLADAVILGEIDAQRPKPQDVGAIIAHQVERIDRVAQRL